MLMYLDSFYKFGYSAVACSRVSNVQLVGCNLRGGRDGLYVCPVCCEPLHYVTFCGEHSSTLLFPSDFIRWQVQDKGSSVRMLRCSLQQARLTERKRETCSSISTHAPARCNCLTVPQLSGSMIVAWGEGAEAVAVACSVQEVVLWAAGVDVGPVARIPAFAVLCACARSGATPHATVIAGCSRGAPCSQRARQVHVC